MESNVVFQAKACGFEDELTAAEEEGLSFGAEVFGQSSVDPMRLQNAHAAWMAPINNCNTVEWYLELCNVAKHRITLGEILNHTTE